MKFKPWMIAFTVVAGLAGVMLLSDRTVKTQEGVDIIRTVKEYQATNDKARDLALNVFQKADEGKELTDADKKKLEEAAKLFEAMKVYDPVSVVPCFGAGKCYMILGDNRKASERFEQSFLNFEADPSRTLSSVRETATEAAGLLSEVSFILGNDTIGAKNSAEQMKDASSASELQKEADLYYDKAYTYATLAVKEQPKSVKYRLAKLNVLLAVGRKEEALKEFEEAKKLNPNDPKVQMFGKMLR
jgi:tetratricopeptide (TPR) repeat protein